MHRTVVVLMLAFPLCAQHIPAHAEDIGPADASLAVDGITIRLRPADSQKSSLQHFLAAQQDAASPEFHHWLTPEEFADRFSRSGAEVEQVAAWLASQGFQIESTARGRQWIVFGGTAGQLETAFHASIHRYRLNGQIHYANSKEPVIPAALSDLVAGFRGLNNFPLRAPLKPLFTDTTGHHLVPDDIATIYGTASVTQGGITGGGIKIAVPGASAIAISDIDSLRSRFNLPVNEPQVILTGTNPGTVSGPLAEADIDIEWSGAVAPNASIIYVYSKNVEAAEQYIVDNSVGQIITSSYGGCESQGSATDNSIAQQANAQGMTWISSSGDSGAAFCDSGTVASHGLGVAAPASYPEVTGVGGTTFSDATGSYWSATNGPNGGSALSYIPEVAWNDSALTSQLSASSGGASVFYSKPLWQNVPGVPADGARDVPDVAFAASPNHDGYEVFTGGALHVYGGTSVATPVFAGMVALLNQSLVSHGAISQPGLGNINSTLYRLARTSPSIFHDIVQGSNLVPCVNVSPNCNNGYLGFFAGPGYDLVTGLGSLNFASLLAQWTLPTVVPSSVTASASPNPSYTKNVTFTLSETNGGATTLTGFTINGTDYSSQIASFFGTANIEPYDSIVAPVSFSTLTAPVTASVSFSGKDPSGRTWSLPLSVQFQPALPASATTIAGVSNGASFKTVFAQGMILSVFGTNFTSNTQAASSLPLPATMQGVSATVNGVTAPLYFVSPSQVNLQIPYGTASGPAMLSVTGTGSVATFPITVQANAPGIFAASGALVPYSTGKHGDTLLAFITGEGAVSPAIATGATPSPTTPYTQLPAPTAAVTVTVGGVNAPVAFVGIPSGLAGATQINFVIPAAAPSGLQPVVVTVGGVASPEVLLTVTQ